MFEVMDSPTEDTPFAQGAVTIERPGAGETLVVAGEAGRVLVLAFDAASARFALVGDDFVLVLEDGARVVFEGLVSAAAGEDPPTVQLAGIPIGADLLVDQALVLGLAAEAEALETAAEEEREDLAAHGGSHYGESFGDLVASLIKQGVLGTKQLGFELVGNGGSLHVVETESLSEGYLLGGDRLATLGVEPEGFSAAPRGDLAFDLDVFAGSQPPPSPAPAAAPGLDAAKEEGAGAPQPTPNPAPAAAPGLGATEDEEAAGPPLPPSPAPAAAPGPDAGEDEGVGGVAPGAEEPDPLAVYAIDIVTNEATGNLQIPDELILYLADGWHGQGLTVSAPSYDGVANNAYIWVVDDVAPDDPNTWANHVNDHVNFHIGNGNPLYQGSFTYEVTNELGASGQGAAGVQNFATARLGSYWTLTGTDADEVLLGLDGRNLIEGGGGDDVIHGGHDASGDILSGGEGNDVIFGGSGNDDLEGGADDDTFIMRAGFGRDDVDGGAGVDTISLESVLSEAHVDDLSAWLSADQGYVHDTGNKAITFAGGASGTIDLGGNHEIAFQGIEQVVYSDVS